MQIAADATCQHTQVVTPEGALSRVSSVSRLTRLLQARPRTRGCSTAYEL